MNWEAYCKGIIVFVPAAALLTICFIKTNHGFPGLTEKVMAVLCLNSSLDKERE